MAREMRRKIRSMKAEMEKMKAKVYYCLSREREKLKY